MTDKEKFNAVEEEIGRLIKHIALKDETDSNLEAVYGGQLYILGKVLRFIDSLPEEPVSEDLEEEVNNWRHQHFHGRRDKDASGEYLDRASQIDLARHFTNWQKEQFEKERLKHCDTLTKDKYEMESDFIIKHLEKNNRTPTFCDAIEYGQKMMIEKACEWLLNNIRYYSTNALGAEYMCDDFRKAMEEEK